MISSIAYCIVGCNPGAPDGQSLHVLACDTATGAAEIVQTVSDVQGTTYFQLDRERKHLYTMTGSQRDLNTHAALVRFELDGHTLGAMKKLCEVPCEAPCHLALSPDGRRLGFAAYLSGTCGTVGIDGQCLATYVFPDDDMGSRPDRQKKALAHQAVFLDPSGVGPRADSDRVRMMGVVDLGCDRIRFFNPETMKPMPGFDIKFDRGNGPRHAIVPERCGNKLLYVTSELASTVSAYAFDGAAFTRLQILSMLPEGCPMDHRQTIAAAIKLSADGKLLMASNRGHDSIAFYEVGLGGRLTLRNIAKLAGRGPRDFELLPGEKFMVVGHQQSNEIQVYRFDRADCTLAPVGKPIPCWQPLCFQFI